MEVHSNPLYIFTHEYREKDLKRDPFDDKRTFLNRHIDSLVDYENKIQERPLKHYERDSLSFNKFRISPTAERVFNGIEFLDEANFK